MWQAKNYKTEKMKQHLDFIFGAIGFTVAVIAPLIDKLTAGLQFTAAALGVVLLWVSIRHKQIEIKIKKKELDGKS